MKSYLLLFLISFTFTTSSFGQSELKVNSTQNLYKQNSFSKTDLNDPNILSWNFPTYLIREANDNLKKYKFQKIPLNKFFIPKDKTETSSSTLPIAIGVWTFFYLLNPIFLFENDKIAGGITKEISLGFGYFGEQRLSFEYSYLFRADLKSHIRLGYKYDILLKKGLKPSNMLQGTSVLSLGGGYFYDFTNHGYFPEISFGYSIRNDKLLFYPNLKLRYTYVAEGSNIMDFSFGIIIGIANPFIDLKIRSKNN